jgi:hypothetical protein
MLNSLVRQIFKYSTREIGYIANIANKKRDAYIIHIKNRTEIRTHGAKAITTDNIE